MVMQQPFEFGAPSPLIDDHEFALAFDFNTPVTINPRALRLDTTPAPIQPSHSALIRPLSAPVASGSGSQHREFVSDVDDSYIPPLPPLESYYDPGPGYLAPYHPLPNQISSFFPEFAEPELSISNDALLPVGADFHDESRRKEIYETGAALTQKISGKRNRKSRLAKQPWHDSESDGFQMEHFERQPPKRAKVVAVLSLPSALVNSGSMIPGPSQPVALPPPSTLLDSVPSMVSSHPVASPPPSVPLASVPSMIPSQPVVTPDKAELLYNPGNRKHKRIVTCATRLVKIHAINTRSVSTQSIRKVLVQQKLQESATKYYVHQAFALDWSLANSAALYMTLSDPFKVIMCTCKKIARNKIALFHLRPGVRSTVNELDFLIARIVELLSELTFPPKFTFGVDELGNSYFLENEVVWHVVLDAVAELELYKYLNNLDSIFCAAAVAVYCALQELATGRFINIEFGGEVYSKLYDKLLEHLQKNSLVPHLLAHWDKYKSLTRTRLMQICRISTTTSS